MIDPEVTWQIYISAAPNKFCRPSHVYSFDLANYDLHVAEFTHSGLVFVLLFTTTCPEKYPHGDAL